MNHWKDPTGVTEVVGSNPSWKSERLLRSYFTRFQATINIYLIQPRVHQRHLIFNKSLFCLLEIHNAELILSGVLKQQLDFDLYPLFHLVLISYQFSKSIRLLIRPNVCTNVYFC